MVSVSSLKEDVQATFEIKIPGRGLSDKHMAKLIKWAVLDFKKKYPLLFTREYSGGRKPKYEWEELLAFDIYCVYSNVRTFRKREEWLTNNDESCDYLLNNKRPCKTTMSDFRIKNSLLFIEFFQHTIDLGVNFGLIGGDIVTLDSTKIKAYANKFKTLSINQLEYLLNLIDDLSFVTSKKSRWFKLRKFFFSGKLSDDLVDLVEEIYSNLNVHGRNLLKTALISCEKRDWVIGWLGELIDNFDGKNRVNLTDPESRRMKMKDGTSRYAYTVQTVRDIKTGFTISQRVTQEKNDKNTLEFALDDAIMALGKAPKYILADNGYLDEFSLEYAYMSNVMPIIPNLTQSMARNGTQKDNPHVKSNMEYNVAEDYYICSGNDKIRNIGVPENSKSNKTVYKASKCNECLFKEECSPRGLKTFHEKSHPLFLDTKKNFHSANDMFLYKYRGIFSEGGFGTLMHARQYPDLRRRGKSNADLDLKIEAIVDNLIKIRDHLKATLITL